MDYQKELGLFLDHYVSDQSQDIRDAVELDPGFHEIDVPKLLAVKGLDENYVFRLKDSWKAWKEAKAQAIPKGFMLVEKKNLEDWYFDSKESMWWDEADVFLSGLNAGEVLEVQHKEYLVTDTTPKYAAVVWDEDNQTTGTWELFDSKDEAEKAAAYCAAKVEEQDNE
ncbi:hypothetical protein KTJ53_16150 [Acinetobacter variabilis]|uniref:hypothetical protein n=1 Tax=Acinetobacter variabilis TaxID=70346 RepID=UPI0021D11A32|nr:hypothetical protein [Acinetobacter variabilis]MCU4631167.1 hypothetical protein [Acinetobacter variabilis]